MNKQNLFHGLIRFFVHHPTASNLLMAGLVVLGLFGAVQLNTQFFPTIQVPSITVTVNWSGASAEDVEENILDAVEPALRFLDGVKEVRSSRGTTADGYRCPRFLSLYYARHTPSVT